QDLYTLLCESYLYIKGTFSVDGAAAEGDAQAAPVEPGEPQTHLVNNCGPSCLTSFDLHKVQWRMPHVYLNEINKLRLLRTLESGRFLSMAFHSWDLYEFPLLQSTTAHSWAIKAATQLEKPRYVIFALQIGRRNAATKDASLFDACDLSNVKLFLNSTFYPYDDMHLDFAKNRYAILYDMYARFRRAYYALDRDDDGAVLMMNKFLHCGPLVVLDCARQNETVKSATVDVRIEFDCRRNVPPETTAYCLILHDRVV
ncbi:hypothetical protein DMN91_006190, partial [Ooceraea biroi]